MNHILNHTVGYDFPDGIHRMKPRILKKKTGYECKNSRQAFLGKLPVLVISYYDSLIIIYYNDNNINGGASFRWSFGPHSAWSSIEPTTILTTHPRLPTTNSNLIQVEF